MRIINVSVTQKLSFVCDVFPDEPLIGIDVHQSNHYCSSCDDLHQFQVVRIGILFVVLGFYYEKAY
jgi:hypothetical protein